MATKIQNPRRVKLITAAERFYLRDILHTRTSYPGDAEWWWAYYDTATAIDVSLSSSYDDIETRKKRKA